MCGCGGSRQKDDCNQAAHSTSHLVNQPWGVPVMCGCQHICSILFLSTLLAGVLLRTSTNTSTTTSTNTQV